MVKLNLQLFAYTGSSVVEYLKSEGKDSSFNARKEYAASAGIANYTGTASQNTQLLNALRNSSTTAPATTTQPTTTSTPTTATTPAPAIAGVSDETHSKMTAELEISDETTDLKSQKNSYWETYKERAGKTDIVDQSVHDKLNSEFVKPSAVSKADSYIKNQLAQIQSGRTSYTDQVEEMIEQIRNRDKFEYDSDSDQLFQQALASAMKSGKSAMQDTIGQASALTGGYGSTYATSAGNQAYNTFIEDAYNNLPEYYQMALQAYQAEGQEMYQQLSMLSDADAREYGRLVDSYNATSQYRNQLYNEAYTQHQDSITNAYNYANLQLNENSQLVNNAYNIYLAASNEYENAYAKEFNEWNAGVQNAYQMAGLEQGAYQYQTSLDYQKERDAVADSQWAQQFAETKRINDAQIAKMSSSGSGGGDTPSLEYPSDPQKQEALRIYNEQGAGAYEQYVKSLPNHVDTAKLDAYIYGDPDNGKYGQGRLPLEQRTWTLTFNGGPNNGGYVDKDARARDQYGQEYTMEQIYNELSKTVGPVQARAWVTDHLQKTLGID